MLCRGGRQKELERRRELDIVGFLFTLVIFVGAGLGLDLIGHVYGGKWPSDLSRVGLEVGGIKSVS